MDSVKFLGMPQNCRVRRGGGGGACPFDGLVSNPGGQQYFSQNEYMIYIAGYKCSHVLNTVHMYVSSRNNKIELSDVSMLLTSLSR